MEKMNCDIIRDLIPSYADGLCSESTKRCVEEHMESCGGCREMLKAYRSHALSGEKLEQKGLDGLKKIKDIMKLQELICYIILVFLLYCGFEVFLANHGNYQILSQPALLFVICILASLLSSMGYRGKNPLGRTEYLLGAASFILDLYIILIFFYLAANLKEGVERIFGRELIWTGPFLERQIIAAFCAQIVFFLYNLRCILKKDKDCRWLLCLNMAGIFLTVNYDQWMKHLEPLETMRQSLVFDTLEILVPGILGVAASLLIPKISRKKLP